MNEKKVKKVSKFLSLVLRHKPYKANIALDAKGWADVDELIGNMQQKGMKIDREILDYAVEHNDKKRFSYNDDKSKIRANQGHSVTIEHDFEQCDPPEFLYHGTISRFMKSIQQQGLKPMGRHHVHLSADIETAKKVGLRRGFPVILKIAAKKMKENGSDFFISKNDVWLVKHIPPAYFEVVKTDQ